MASEQSYDGETPRLCANGCVFFGRAETRNLCSKCHRQACLEEVIVTIKDPVVDIIDDYFPVPVSSSVQDLKLEEGSRDQGKSRDRCGCCNKKVGLVKGFKCRCGNVYCSAHRYPEEHRCTFDFKAAGRALLAKANPVVQADKLERIRYVVLSSFLTANI